MSTALDAATPAVTAPRAEYAAPRTMPRRRPPRLLVRVGGALGATGVALLAFDDVRPLRALGGGLLASPGWIPLLLAAVILVRGSGLFMQRLLWGTCLAVVLYGVVLTSVTVLASPIVAYGEHPTAKAIRVLGAFLIWIAVLLSGYVLVRTVPRYLLLGTSLMLVVMLMGAVLWRFGVHVIDDSSIFHSAADIQQRVRSTRFEASSLGGGVLAGSALCVALLRRPMHRFAACFCGLAVTVALTESRGTELIAVVGLVLLVALQILRPAPRVVTVGSTIIVLMAVGTSIGLATLVQSDLWHAAGLSDGAHGTSDATRAGWAFASMNVLATSPLGLGFGTYLQEVPHLLHAAMTSLAPNFRPSALLELRVSAGGVSDTGVSPKTAPTLAAFHLGWIGLVALCMLWFAVLRRAYGAQDRSLRSSPLYVSVLCVVLVAAAYYSSLIAWEQGLLYGVVLGAAMTRRRSRRAATDDSRSRGSAGPRLRTFLRLH